MTCRLCRKPLRRAVREFRRPASGGRSQAWAYCRSCRAGILRQWAYLATEPMHGHSTPIAGGTVDIVRVRVTREENLA